MKKLLTFLTLLTLFFGVGWAETITVDFEGNAIPTGWTASKFTVVSNPISNTSSTNGSYCASTGGNSTDVTLTYDTKLTGVTSISIDAAKTTNNSNGSMNIEFSTDNTNWEDAEFMTATIARNSWTTTTLTLDQATDGYVRISFSGTTAVKFIDNIVINYGTSTPTETVATPTFDPSEGTYTSAQNVAISCETSGATIYYTTNGSTPTTTSSVYTTPIAVGSTTTIKAIAVKSGMNNSAVASATYTINLPVTSTKFERVTSISSADIGKRFIIVSESAGLALDNSGTNKNNGTSVTISSHQTSISSDENVGIFTLGAGTEGYTFAYSANDFMTLGNSSTGLGHGLTAADLSITFNNGNSIIASISNGRRISCYGAQDFRTYASWSTGQEVQLYKEVENEVQVDDLYLIGYGMNGTEGWNLTTAPQMAYSNSAGSYSVDVYFDKAQRGMFQFAKGLSNSNSNWDGLTGRLYPSTNGSNVSVDTYDMDGTVGLYFTDNSNTYSFELPAGLYTITANLSEWKTYVTQHEVTMTATANGYFDDSKNVTLSSNLTAAPYNGKIYYTTDGTDPKTSSTRQEYNGALSFTETTTLKAVAELGYIYSEVVERTYTKTPKTPVINPNGGIITGETQVTITCETTGAEIYYTLDGSVPTKESTLYTGTFTINTTTTVKARAYVGDTYGGTATAEFTYREPVQPGTGEFQLVTSAEQIVAGNEYIIMSTIYDEDFEEYENYAFGAISNTRANTGDGYTVEGTIGEVNSKVSLGDNYTVNVLSLEGEEGAWNLKQVSDELYIIPAASSTGISTGSACDLVITIGSDYVANIQNSATSDTRQIRYYDTTNGYFRNYGTSQNDTYDVYLYYRGGTTVAKPVINPASKVFTEEFDATITCSTQGATIYYTIDGTDPTTSSAVYSNPIHVDKTMTIKAIAAKDGEVSGIAEAVYQCTMVENIAEYLTLPIGTENIVFKNPVVVQYHYISSSGKSYIYVKDDTGCAYFHQPYETEGTPSMTQLENGDVIGARFYGDKDYDEAVGNNQSIYAMFTNLENFAATGNKALAEPELKTVSEIIATNAAELNNHYITIKKVKLSNLYQALSYGGDKYFDIYDETGQIGQDHIGYNKFNIDYASVVDDLDAYYNITGIFTAYNNKLEFHPTEIYKWAEKEVTLADLCENGEEGESYKITNNLQGVVAVGTSLWVKDENGQSIHKVTPTAPYTENFEVLADGNTRSNQADYDQSNWCEIVFPDATTAKSFENKIISGYSIEGVFNKKANPKLTLSANAQVEEYGTSDVYAPNYYLPANFVGSQSCNTVQYGQEGHGDFFFMTPKPQEYAQIVWAIYDGVKDGKPTFIISPDKNRNAHQFSGVFVVDLSMNTGVTSTSQITEGYGYDFTAIIRMVETTSSNAPSLKRQGDIQNDQSANYVVYPLDLDEGQNPATAINTVDVNGKAVKSVKYVNVAGMVSDKPFSGVNIVVTEYTDGSCTTSKMLRK